MKLHETRWNVNGQPLLGGWGCSADKLWDLQYIRDAGMNIMVARESEVKPDTPEGAFCLENGIKVIHDLTQFTHHGVKLRDAITPDQTTIPLYFSRGIPDQGSHVVQIDDEIIRYEAMTEAGLVNCRRGRDGTHATAHREGVILFWPEPCAAEIKRVKDWPHLFGYYVLDDSPGDVASALQALYKTVQRVDPGGRHPVCAGFQGAGGVINLAPGVCDIMLIYWYPVGSGYDRESTAEEVQHIMMEARQRVPGIAFAGVYQAFGSRPAQPGQGVPTPEQLREQLEDFVREGACGLFAYRSGRATDYPGWTELPALVAAIGQANREILATGGLEVRPETEAMARKRIQPQGYLEKPRPLPGVVPAWYLVGPFEDTQGKLLNAVFPPDQGIDLNGVYPVKFGSGGWRVRRTTSGVLGLTDLYGEHIRNGLAYAFCDVTSPKEQVAQMRICSDDDAWVRLNGKEVYRFEGGRGLDYDKDVVPITLPAGKSRLEVKSYNRVGMWGFVMRFTDLDGQPLEGLRFSPADG